MNDTYWRVGSSRTIDLVLHKYINMRIIFDLITLLIEGCNLYSSSTYSFFNPHK